MTPLHIIIYIIIAHAIGDYVLQSSYLAGNKGKDDYILLIHCYDDVNNDITGYRFIQRSYFCPLSW